MPSTALAPAAHADAARGTTAGGALLRRARSAREHLLFAAGALTAAAYVAPDSAPAAAVIAAVALLASRVPSSLRAAIAFTAGAVSVASGVLVGPAGLPLVPAGLLLLVSAGLALRTWRPVASPWRRWGRRALVAVAALALLPSVVLPVVGGVYLTHKPAEHVATTELPVAHEDVTLQTSDGLDIAAWYVPSRNGAAVIAVHGAGGDRSGGIKAHALMLARHGYGVLLFDARGRGESDGEPNGMGWTWQPEVDAAVEYLGRRPDVTDGRIGALGLSTGAEVLLESAARRSEIRAVVADGAIAPTPGDTRRLPGRLDQLLALPYRVTFATIGVLDGSSPSKPLVRLVPRIAPRPLLLISTGTGPEAKMNRVYFDAARGPKQLWELSDVAHTDGLDARRAEYEARVLGFLDRALLS